MPSNQTNPARYALDGRVVTMDDAFTVIDQGVVYIDGQRIAAVLPRDAPAPVGFESITPLKTRGTIYPGLIELHNHLSYNALPPWPVPKLFANRDQWSARADYHKAIVGPMSVLGKTAGYPEAIVRYVECKCLLAGVTTSQGIALASDQGITRFYQGAVRNAEQPDDPTLPHADTHILDVEAKDAQKFLDAQKRSSCLLLHLSEGINSAAHQHFEALKLGPDQWAILKSLAGIHCVALAAADFEVMQARGASMIWSPLSNFLLYGKTADIKAAKDSGMLIGIGSDWSPSGSKNLFGELKVAHLVSSMLGDFLSAREILGLATRNAAAILRWDQLLGSLELNKLADLIVLEGHQGDPYQTFLKSAETAISLVVIAGVPRYGRKALMEKLNGQASGEAVRVGGSARLLNVTQDPNETIVRLPTLADARDKLKDGLHRIAELAAALEKPKPAAFHVSAEPHWFLVLDHEEPSGIALRPHLPLPRTGRFSAITPMQVLKAPLSTLLEPIALDALTVADDETYFVQLAKQANVPGVIKQQLSGLY